MLPDAPQQLGRHAGDDGYSNMGSTQPVTRQTFSEVVIRAEHLLPVRDRQQRAGSRRRMGAKIRRSKRPRHQDVTLRIAPKREYVITHFRETQLLVERDRAGIVFPNAEPYDLGPTLTQLGDRRVH